MDEHTESKVQHIAHNKMINNNTEPHPLNVSTLPSPTCTCPSTCTCRYVIVICTV